MSDPIPLDAYRAGADTVPLADYYDVVKERERLRERLADAEHAAARPVPLPDPSHYAQIHAEFVRELAMVRNDVNVIRWKLDRVHRLLTHVLAVLVLLAMAAFSAPLLTTLAGRLLR